MCGIPCWCWSLCPALIHTVPRFCHSTSSFNSSQRLHQNKTFQPQSSSSFRLEIPHRTTVSFEMTHCFWTDSWLKVATFSDSFYDGIPWPSSKSSELLTESIPFCFNTLSLPTATIRQPKKWVWKSQKKIFEFGKKKGVTTSGCNRLYIFWVNFPFGMDSSLICQLPAKKQTNLNRLRDLSSGLYCQAANHVRRFPHTSEAEC